MILQATNLRTFNGITARVLPMTCCTKWRTSCIYFIRLYPAQVTDTNDNPPVFAEPAYSFDIPENAQRGYHVGVIQATDPDIGTNAAVTYTVISDWANDVFSLNPQTGIFTLTARLDYEEVSTIARGSSGGCPSNDAICASFLFPKPRYSITFWWCRRRTMDSRACQAH